MADSPLRCPSALVWMGLLSLTLTLMACGPQAAPQKPNMILITVDTTRADRLGCYGNERVSTPAIDRVADEGTLFAKAFASTPITAPSHTSILSGTYPPFHQVRDNGSSSVPEHLPWLATILGGKGYQTAGIIAAYPLKGVFGFGRGFDYFSDVLEAPPGRLIMTNLHTVGVASRKGERISAEFVRWFENRQPDPFFVWLHYYDPHWPHEAQAGYAEIYQNDPYLAEIAYMDDSISTVLRTVENAGLADSTGVVIVGDHGESLMEHGELTHALLAYNSTLHVPLVARFPWIEHRAGKVEDNVSIVDVAPTILEALGLDVSHDGPGMQGRSLLPVIQEENGPDPADRTLYFETFYPYFHYGWGVLTGVIEGGWKYIQGPDDELFDLKTDFGELDNRADDPRREELHRQLAEMSERLMEGRPARRSVVQDRQTAEMLRALGYMAGDEPVSADTLPEMRDLPIPRENLSSYFAYNAVLSAMNSKRYAEAVRICSKIVEENPSHKDALMLLANAHVMLGNPHEAVGVFDQMLAQFRDAEILFQAGAFYLDLDQPAKAIEFFEEVVAQDPEDTDTLTLLGTAMSRAGRPDEARTLWETVLTIEPKSRDALNNLTVQLCRTNDPGCRELLERSLDAFPFDPELNFNYGVFLIRSGKGTEGLDYLRRASTLAGGSIFEPAHFALASIHAQRGEVELAREYLREIVIKTGRPESLKLARQRLAELEAGGR